MSDYGVGIWTVDPTLDFAAFTEVTGGVEVYVDGTGWVECDTTDYDPETPGIFYALWSATDLTGRVWRFKDPVTSWTCGGLQLLPTTGVFTSPPPGAMAPPILRTQ